MSVRSWNQLFGIEQHGRAELQKACDTFERTSGNVQAKRGKGENILSPLPLPAASKQAAP